MAAVDLEYVATEPEALSSREEEFARPRGTVAMGSVRDEEYGDTAPDVRMAVQRVLRRPVCRRQAREQCDV